MAGTDKTSNIYINGKQAGNTLADLRKQARELNNEMQRLPVESEEFRKKQEELANVRGKLAQHTNEIKRMGDTMGAANKTAADRLKELNERVQSGTMDARQMSRAIMEYQTIALQAGRTSPVGQQAIKDAAGLQDTLADLRNEITRTAHDGANFQAALQLGSTAIAGYGVAKASMSALGIESESLQETFVKLQATTTALNGIEQIRTNLEKESFLMIKAKTLATTVLTAATTAYNAVVGTSVGIMKVLRIVMLAIPLIAIATGVALIVSNWEKLMGWIETGIDKFRQLGTGIKIAIAVMIPIVGVIWAIIEALEYFGVIEEQNAKIVNEAAEKIKQKKAEILKAARENVAQQIEANNRLQKSITETYDWEIAKAKAAGQNTRELEAEKRAELRKTYEESIRLHEESMKLNATSFTEQIKSARRIAEAKAAIKASEREDELESIRMQKENSDKAIAQADKTKQEFERLQKELTALHESELKYRQELERQAELENLEGMERELQQTEWKIDAKYAKEIAAAEELAKRTDQIGQQARERLASLEILKAEELGAEKARITAEWTAKAEEEAKAIRQKAAQDELNIRDANLKTQMALAHMHYNDIADWEVQKKAEALQRIYELEMQAAEMDRDRRMTDLEIQYENEAISYEEFLAYKEELETEHLERMADLNRENNAKNEEDLRKSIEGALGAIQQVSQALGAFRNAQHNREMAQIDNQKKAEIKALDEQLKKGIISEEEYQRKVDTINEESDAKEAAAKRKKAEQDKKAALIEAAIATALAIVKAAPNPVLMALAGVVGGIQLAAIAAQPIPQFKKGGYNVTGAQDGKTYNAQYIGKHQGGMLPSHPVVLASEAGPEYFVPNPLLHHPEVIDHVRAIENIRTGHGIRQFAEGGATEQLPQQTNQQQETNTIVFQQIVQMLEMNMIVLSEVRDMLPNLAVVIGDDKVDELRERMDQIEQIRA